MWKDPVVAETRALRDEYVRQFNYDAGAIYEDLVKTGYAPGTCGFITAT